MSEQPLTRVLPPDTEITRPFREGCAAGELRLQCCKACGSYQFYPRILCSHCGAGGLEWRVVSGRGVVASFTVVRRGISPAYEAPYVVALIDLQEGPRMMSNIVGCEPEEVAVGAAVQVQFERWSDEYTLPVFVLSEV